MVILYSVVLLTEHPIVDLQQEMEGRTKNLDIARGKFQIAMVLNLASDIDQSGELSGGILIVCED